jgi:hypothetical protein
MPDPLTVIGGAASALQVAKVALDIFVALSTFYDTVQQAPEQKKGLREELDSLVNLLRDIQNAFKDKGESNAKQLVQKEINTLHLLLSRLRERTRPMKACGLRALKWPFEKAATRSILETVERFKKNVGLIMNSETL